MLQSIVLGILQGLTEFLPISSSAHLILLPWLSGWKPMGIAFDVMIHGGTLLAILIYFWEDWKNLLATLFDRLRGRSVNVQDRLLIDSILLGTFPAGIVALLFHDYIEEYARQPMVTVVTLSVFGVLLWWTDRTGEKSRKLSSITIRDGLLVGAGQALALIPGVSRSGITITVGLFLGLNRPDAARYSFLLGTPIIALGALDGMRALLADSGDAAALGLGPLIAGVVASFVVGFLCIKFFLKFLESWSYTSFVIYRIVLAVVIFVVWAV
ncbi:MAG: undecaprenyl-diphosphatase UppP [Acidobacteriota bacterium]|nr:MAG: undecaprenyl-diphosphatase UppP [Acidobacteriota bacterium]